MSKAQKLVNRAVAILQRQLPPDNLNDQKALAELRNLFDGTEDDGQGTASERVKRAMKILVEHTSARLNDQQAITAMHGVLD